MASIFIKLKPVRLVFRNSVVFATTPIGFSFPYGENVERVLARRSGIVQKS
jgi:hypothetical protein